MAPDDAAKAARSEEHPPAATLAATDVEGAVGELAELYINRFLRPTTPGQLALGVAANWSVFRPSYGILNAPPPLPPLSLHGHARLWHVIFLTHRGRRRRCETGAIACITNLTSWTEDALWGVGELAVDDPR